MGRVKITEKPGIWPYVLVNDFNSPPYFAYIHVDADGKESFVRVLKGAPEEDPAQNPILNLTLKRKAKIMKFLKEVIKTPSKYGEFMSKEWIQQLVKFLDLYDEETIQAISHIVDRWLKDRVFETLLKEISESLTAAPKVSEEEPEKNLVLKLTQNRKAKIIQFLKEVLKTPLKYGEFMSKEWIQQLVKFLDLFDEKSIDARSLIVEKWLKDRLFEKLLKEISERSAASTACKKSEETTVSSSQEAQQRQASEKKSSDEDDLFTAFVVRRVKRRQVKKKMD